MHTVATSHGEGPLGRGATRVAQLVVVEGPDMGRAARIEPNGALVVGTAAGATAGEQYLVLTDDRVSRRHVVLRSVPGGFAVEDLGSRNGTFHEGTRIGSVTVPLGATLKLGKTFVRVLGAPERIEIPPSQSRTFGAMVGESLAMREVFAILERVAETDATVLLEGETGVGKELAARALHDASERARGAQRSVPARPRRHAVPRRARDRPPLRAGASGARARGASRARGGQRRREARRRSHRRGVA
jgi:hypothetical protein